MLADLAKGLRFAPAATLRRAVERIEAMPADIDPGTRVPRAWVVFRITGYRPEEPGGLGDDGREDSIAGSELLAGLSSLGETLSEHAVFAWEDLDQAGAVERESLAAMWGVSGKTIDRLRREGLVARRARRSDGKVVLAFMPKVVAWGKARFTDRLAKATGVSRLSAQDRARIVALAARLRRRAGCSLNQAAAMIAPRVGRALETIRQVLRSADVGGAVFGERGPVRERDGRWMDRAWRRGADPAILAERAGCARPAAQRAINLVRSARLRAITSAPGWPELKGDVPGAEALAKHATLTPTRVREGLRAWDERDALRLLAGARTRIVVPPREERTLLSAIRMLDGLAAAWARGLDRLAPDATRLDAVETALRWSALLRVEVVRPLLTLVVETVEGVLGFAPERLSAADLRDLLTGQVEVLAWAVDQADPMAGGRVAGAAALGLSQHAARWARAHPGASKETRASVAAVEFPAWPGVLAPWRGWIGPDDRLRGVLTEIDEFERKVLACRAGWGGSRPLTLDEVAAKLGVARVKLPAIERRAVRTGLGLVRGIRQ
jgi:hypothetical protein